MTRHVRDFAEELDVPVGAVLEGGYEPLRWRSVCGETLIGTRRR